MPPVSSLALPLGDLLCTKCGADDGRGHRTAFLPYQATCVELPGEEGRGPVQVTLHMHRVLWRRDQRGHYVAFAEISLPCPGCGGGHRFDHLMEAPLIFLRNLSRCQSCGGEYRLEDETIEYSESSPGAPRIEVGAK